MEKSYIVTNIHLSSPRMRRICYDAPNTLVKRVELPAVGYSSMHIVLATPAPPQSKKGNRVTGARWAGFLRELGHSVQICREYDGGPCDLLIAVHAFKSYASVQKFHDLFPHKPLIVNLAGTDLYGSIHNEERAKKALEMATHLVLLQELGIDELQEHLKQKATVIIQSASPPKTRFKKTVRHFDVCVLGHLRPVKDPMRAARAARLLPQSSRVRILHAGGAIDPSFAELAETEQQENPRYHWLGELPRWRAQRLLGRSQLMVLSSLSEGGANVISEALAAGVPTLASHVPGNVGLLGKDYPGYYPVKDSKTLAGLILRAETEPLFLASLRDWVANLAETVHPDRERAAWAELLTQAEQASSFKLQASSRTLG